MLFMTNKYFLLLIESILSGTQYLNILVGSLQTPHVSYLYDCQPLKCPNSNIIPKAVDDAFGNLGINRSFCLLLSDAAKYMIVTVITLKSLYRSCFT